MISISIQYQMGNQGKKTKYTKQFIRKHLLTPEFRQVPVAKPMLFHFTKMRFTQCRKKNYNINGHLYSINQQIDKRNQSTNVIAKSTTKTHILQYEFKKISLSNIKQVSAKREKH